MTHFSHVAYFQLIIQDLYVIIASLELIVMN